MKRNNGWDHYYGKLRVSLPKSVASYFVSLSQV